MGGASNKIVELTQKRPYVADIATTVLFARSSGARRAVDPKSPTPLRWSAGMAQVL